MLDHCDAAGVIDLDLDLAAFQIGGAKGIYTLSHTLCDTLSEIGDRMETLPCGKRFIPKFIPFQYGKISADCKAHNPVFQSLEKHFPKGYSKGMDTLLGRVQEKDKDKDSSLSSESSDSEGGGKPLCTLAQALSYAPTAGLTEAEATFWFHARNKSGWTCGTANGGAARKITSFQSDMHSSVSWIREGLAKESKNKPKFKGIQEDIPLI